MPAKSSGTGAARGRGRPTKGVAGGSGGRATPSRASGGGHAASASVSKRTPTAEADTVPSDGGEGAEEEEEEEDDDDFEAPKSIPPELITRLLHEFFDKDGVRITKDANAAVAKYMDVFVREAIARAAAERTAGFLEVEDLEKIAPQLLLDL